MEIGTIIALIGLTINVMVTLGAAMWFVMRMSNVTTRLSVSIEHLERLTESIRRGQQTQDGRINAIENRLAGVDERLRRQIRETQN